MAWMHLLCRRWSRLLRGITMRPASWLGGGSWCWRACPSGTQKLWGVQVSPTASLCPLPDCVALFDAGKLQAGPFCPVRAICEWLRWLDDINLRLVHTAPACLPTLRAL